MVRKMLEFCGLDSLPTLDALLLRSVALHFSKGRTSAADDVVIEMLLACDDMVFDVFAQIFLLRFLNHETDDSEQSWKEHVVKHIGKKDRSTYQKHSQQYPHTSIFEKIDFLLHCTVAQ